MARSRTRFASFGLLSSLALAWGQTPPAPAPAKPPAPSAQVEEKKPVAPRPAAAKGARRGAAKPAPAALGPHGPVTADEGYAKKIREFTTAPVFLTELVDHLPSTPKVPTPEKFLGYIAGAKEKLTYAKDIHAYMRELERSSPRVKTAPLGQTEEGREMLLVMVSDEANLARLPRLKEITAKLADPRGLKPADAEKLIGEGVPFYWATAAIHSTETGAPEMLMELAYRLAVEETPFIQNIRRNAVILITPVVEVDGREKAVDLYRYKLANPGKPVPSLVYWGKYVAHDNNRDGMALALALSRNITKGFLEYHPQVLHDLHESVPFLYTSTGMGPYNAWLDPIEINEWQKLAYHEIEEMTKRGVPGIWTHGFYDGWGANYLMEVAHGHNSVGRFYETFGNGNADTRTRTVPAAQTTRQWYRPNPPYSQVLWSHRNNVNMQQSALLLALNYTATNKETFLRNFYLKSRRSVEKAATEGPAAYLLDAVARPNEAASLVEQLRMHGVEVQTLDAATAVGSKTHPAGTFVVRMDQPYSRLADMLLDKQFYNPNDTPPYDDTGWTLPYLRNIASTRVTDVSILKAPMTAAGTQLVPKGSIAGEGSYYLLPHNADRALATFRYKHAAIKMESAEAAFEAAGKRFGAGTILIPAEGNPSDLRAVMEAAARDFGFTFTAVKEAPAVAKHALQAPRIALIHNWTSTQNEGWARLALETTGIPYTYLADRSLAQLQNLRRDYDVILLGPSNLNSQRLVNGLALRGQPMPWKATPEMPNLATSPDQTEDMRGGIGLQGLVNLQRFVEEGGLFVTIGGNASLPIDFGLIEGISITPARELKARGSVLDSTIADAKSPIAYGYGERLPVYFNQAPILEAGLGGFARAGVAEPSFATRVSGRGGVDDPDVVQARMPAPVVVAAPGEAEESRGTQVPPAERPRVVVRFAAEKELLLSGMLAGGRELASKPAVVDVPKGKGHIVMFAINPLWRQQTQGSYMLLFNALMNFENLGVGR